MVHYCNGVMKLVAKLLCSLVSGSGVIVKRDKFSK